MATIAEIQGSGHISPLLGQVTDTTGIVTAVDDIGFYLQDPIGDGNPNTSEALFVFTGGDFAVAVGDEVMVDGTVSEFTPGGTTTGNLSTTQLSGVTAVEVLSSGNALPAATIIGAGGRIPPNQIIDDDAFGTIPGQGNFDPTTDGIDFFESLEGMRVTAQDAVAVAGTNRFGETFAVVDGGNSATGLSDRGTLNISPDDFNPERVQIDPSADIFDLDITVDTGTPLGDVTGVIGYSFGNFEIIPTQALEPATALPNVLAPETTLLTPSDDELTVASYNVLNLDPNDDDGDEDVADGRFEAIAQQVVNNLGAPDILALQEIQDNDGSEITGVSAADVTLQTLADAIAAAGGPAYQVIDTPGIIPAFEDGEGNVVRPGGGQPGGNIRNAFLYNPERVDLVAGSVQALGSQAPGETFEGARLPLVASFTFNGETVTLVNNHFSSKGGSAPILGVEQLFEQRQEDVAVNGSLDERQAQSAAVQAFVTSTLSADSDANLMVLGDLNEFEFVSPVTGLEAAGLTNLTNQLPEDERYTFIFQGNSQSLDHILVSNSLEGAEFDIVHVNAEFAASGSRASDHDPLVARLSLGGNAPDPETPAPMPPETPDPAPTATPSPQILGTTGNDRLFGGNGPDTLIGLAGDDELRGGQRDDTLRGGLGDDQLFGGAGQDSLIGGPGDDELRGGSQRDNLSGGSGNDRLFGGAGQDDLRGGAGNDVLVGGAARDRLFGGAGQDVFVLQTGPGFDTIRDFVGGTDTLGLSGRFTFEELTITSQGANTRITATGDPLALLLGVAAGSLTAADFVAV